MPIFEYQCKDCGTPYEVFHKSREHEDIIECPSCHSRQHMRKLSVFATAASGTYSYKENSCASGTCDMPSGGGCANGMCGLN